MAQFKVVRKCFSDKLYREGQIVTADYTDKDVPIHFEPLDDDAKKQVEATKRRAAAKKGAETKAANEAAKKEAKTKTEKN